MLDFLSSLGLVTWDWDPALIRIGSFELRYYGVLFALALAVGYMTIRWRYKDENEDPEKATNLTYAIMIAVVVGARLFHCFFYDFDRYMADPIEILKFWKGGLASHGAGTGIILTCIIYDLMRKTPIRVTVDRLAYCIPFAMICVRLGNFFNSEIVGAPCDPDFPLAFIFTRYDAAMGLPPTPRYPSQLFEVFMGIIAGCVMFGTYKWYKNRGRKVPLGMPVSLILVSYFSMRFIVEFFKEYQVAENIGGLREGQILSLPFLTLGLIGLGISLFGPWNQQYAEQFTKNYQIKSENVDENSKNNENPESNKENGEKENSTNDANPESDKEKDKKENSENDIKKETK